MTELICEEITTEAALCRDDRGNTVFLPFAAVPEGTAPGSRIILAVRGPGDEAAPPKPELHPAKQALNQLIHGAALAPEAAPVVEEGNPL